MSATQSLPAQRMPAWKRLGLKLKAPGAGAGAGASSSGAQSATTTTSSFTPSNNNKRKEYPSSATTSSAISSASKRLRTDSDAPTLARRKSVSFADGTKGSDPIQAASKNKKKKTSKPKKKSVDQASKPAHLQPQLSEYLRQWHSARDTWKFKKNLQTLLIKYAFESDMIPAADFPVFLEYARDCKGASRTWLKNEAEALKKKDTEGPGADLPEAKRQKYQDLLSNMLQRQAKSNANGKRLRNDYSDEEDFVMGGTDAAETRDPELTQRLVKRLRADLVLQELSDTEASDASTSTSTTAGGSVDESASNAGAPVSEDAKMKDGAQKRQRSRKKRTLAEDDDTSSSDDSSDDDGDAKDADDDDSTSSSGTSSDSDDSDASDTESAILRLQRQREELESSSESSSSSDSDSDSSDSGVEL